ncbi:MAG: autoinducer 2 ABC transporter substrate-binding protein [Pseudomonadota bacterium]
MALRSGVVIALGENGALCHAVSDKGPHAANTIAAVPSPTRARLLPLLFAAALVFAPRPTAAEDIRVAFVPQIAGIPYYAAMRRGAERAANDLGVTYVQDGPTTTNPVDQLRIFESFVAQQFDVVAVSPVDEESLRPAIQRARQSGAIVLTADADAPQSDRHIHVAQALDQALGETLIDETVARVGASGKIAIISDAATIQSMQRWIEAIRNRVDSRYPDLTIVSVDHTDGTARRAYQFATDAMTRHPDLSAILGIASTTCPGIAQAVEAARAVGTVLTAGFCSPNTARSYIKSGAMPFTVLWDPGDLGYLTVWVGHHLATGNAVDGDLEVEALDHPVHYDAQLGMVVLGPPTVFTADNVDAFDF